MGPPRLSPRVPAEAGAGRARPPLQAAAGVTVVGQPLALEGAGHGKYKERMCKQHYTVETQAKSSHKFKFRCATSANSNSTPAGTSGQLAYQYRSNQAGLPHLRSNRWTRRRHRRWWRRRGRQFRSRRCLRVTVRDCE